MSPKALMDDSLGSDNGQCEGEVKAADEKISFRTLPRKSKILLLLCGVANFASCLSYAVPSPFYPQEAEEKGLSQEMIGIFFSIYEVVVFLTSPVFGLQLSRIGPRFLLLSGIFLAGAGSLVFGLLGHCPGGDSFLVLSLVNRAIISLGYSAFVTSMQVTILTEIPGNEGLAFSLMEGSAGAGFIVGPAVGGVLFELGGFGLPFYIIGGIVILCGVFLHFVLPPIKEVNKGEHQPSVFRILRSPLVWISLPCISMCAIGMGFLDPTLAKHLDPFDLSTGVIGLFFLIVSVVYCVSTPVWGWLSDHEKIGQGPLLVTGAITTGIGFLVLGPSPWLGFLPFETWTVILGLVLLGMSQPSGMIPTIKCLTTAAVDSGLEDNVDTYGMVVGLYNLAYCLGATVGPLLAGFFVERYGFNTGINIVGSGNFGIATICLVYFVIRFNNKNKNKHKPLRTDDGREPKHVTPTDRRPSPSDDYSQDYKAADDKDGGVPISCPHSL